MIITINYYPLLLLMKLLLLLFITFIRKWKHYYDSYDYYISQTARVNSSAMYSFTLSAVFSMFRNLTGE
jgi:hypothetical protein